MLLTYDQLKCCVPEVGRHLLFSAVQKWLLTVLGDSANKLNSKFTFKLSDYIHFARQVNNNKFNVR